MFPKNGEIAAGDYSMDFRIKIKKEKLAKTCLLSKYQARNIFEK